MEIYSQCDDISCTRDDSYSGPFNQWTDKRDSTRIRVVNSRFEPISKGTSSRSEKTSVNDSIRKMFPSTRTSFSKLCKERIKNILEVSSLSE